MPDEPTRPEHVTRARPGQSDPDEERGGPAPVGHPPAAPAARGTAPAWPAENPPPGYWPGGGPPPGSNWPGGGPPAGSNWPGGAPGDEDEDDDWPEDDEAGGAWPPPPGGAVDQPHKRRPVVLAVIGVVALLVGAGVTLAVTSELSPSAPPAASRTQSPVTAGPGGSGQQPGGALPGGGGTVQMFIAGRVQAISPTSITLGAPGRAVTAAITSSTKVSGRVTRASQIKVGDNASAQITMRHGKSVVTAIQDPAEQPSGGLP